MNERYDDDGRGPGGTALDVRALLEDASWPGQRDSLDPHEHWSSGRRRRSRKRAGAGVLGGVALVAVAGLVWQAGVFGGELGPLEPHVANLPSGLTTFVLAAPDADAAGAQQDGAQLQVADAEALAGTSWVLTDQVWGSDQRATEVVGSDAETVFSFAGADSRGWGFVADDCGGGWFQDDLRLTADGSFGSGGDLATTDIGCPEPAQVAEDFWGEVLPRGGTLHALDHDWLLLSVDVTAAQGEQAPPTTSEDATDAPGTPTEGTAAPGTPAEQTGQGSTTPGEPPTAAPTPPAASPPVVTPPAVTPPVVTPSAPATPSDAAPPGSPTPPATTPAAPSAPDGGLAFLDPGEQWIGQPWPAASGGIYAPSVRAGVHDGFDRIVLDLTSEPGATGPGWYAAYTPDPRRDGSGLPAGVAGDSVLEVVLNSMALPEPDDPVYDGGDFGLDTHRLSAVIEVIRTTPFEGQLQLFIGMQGEPRPYRVFLLQAPLRLVVDVQTS